MALDLSTQLKALGLHDNEVVVYLALFDIGRTRAGALISHTALHRNIVYTALEELVRRGLVSKFSVRNVAEFAPNDPEVLLVELDARRAQTEKLVAELKQKQTSDPREVRVFEGLDGLRESRERMLRHDSTETLHILGAIDFKYEPEYDEYVRDFHARRNRQGISAKLLFEHSIPDTTLTSYNAWSNTQAKRLPFGGRMPVYFAGIGDQFDIFIHGKEPITFSFKSREAVEGLTKFFDYFWNQKVSSETGYDEVQRTFDSMLDELSAGEEYLVLGANSGNETPQLQSYFESFHKRRVQKGVGVKMMASKNAYQQLSKRFVLAGDPEGRMSSLKHFPSSVEQPFQINLFHNKANLYVYSDPPTMIRFEDEVVFNGFKSYFDTLWNQESYILTGPTAVRDFWMQGIDAGELLFIGARGYFVDRYPQMYEEVLEYAKKTKTLSWKILADNAVRGHRITKFPWVETKFVFGDIPNPNVVWLFGSTVAVVNWSKDEPILFVSHNQFLVQSYRDYFDALWNGPVNKKK